MSTHIITERAAFVRLLQAAAADLKRPVGGIYVYVYECFKAQHHIDLPRRAKNRGLKTIQYAEDAGHMSALFALACSRYTWLVPALPKTARFVPKPGEYLEPWAPGED